MIRTFTWCIFAAVLVLFPLQSEAKTYRAKETAIGCESIEALRELFEAVISEDNDQGLLKMESLINEGRCVRLAGARLYVERTNEKMALVKISADPRPLWTFRSSIDWTLQ